jgi:SAM-dependent methyltransferase
MSGADCLSCRVVSSPRESAGTPAGVAVPRDFSEVLSGYQSPRILDFGCGYGRSLIALLEAGYDVWGVDVSEREAESARTSLLAKGLDSGRVAVLDPLGRSPYPDGSFDVIFSEQVLEHVADIERVVTEIDRLLRPGGTTLHQWPARWRIVEGHLKMPVVHWLPKNRSRHLAIRLWMALGIGKKTWPPELDAGEGRRGLAEFRYRYSIDQTFYRSPRVIEAAFRARGFETSSGAHPRVEALPAYLRPGALAGIRAFKTVRLVARKGQLRGDEE